MIGLKMDYQASVIITSHNYGRFLDSAVNSVLNQTVKPKEIIVVNDASDDHTEEVASFFGDRIQYFQVNFRNAQKTRNYGLSKASGEYVVFLDADDYFRNDFLEKTQNIMKNNSKIRLVYSDRENIGTEDLLASIGHSSNWKSKDFNYNALRKYNYISLPSLIRRKYFKGFDEKIRRFQDWEAWLNFLKPKSAVRIPEPLFFVRFHEQNKTFTENKSIEKIKVLYKHGVLGGESLDIKKILLENLLKIKNVRNGFVFLNLSDNFDDLIKYLDNLKKCNHHVFFYLINGHAEDQEKTVRIEKYLSDNGWKHRISNSMNSDQLLDTMKRNEFMPLDQLDYIHVINKAKIMNDMIKNNSNYKGNDMQYSCDRDLMDCISIDELDVLLFYKRGIQKFYNIRRR
jgi:glycosyltransferase involved in cell wall biosynthesis